MIASGKFKNGLVTAPVRVIAEALGYDRKRATVNGREIVGSQTVGDTSLCPG